MISDVVLNDFDPKLFEETQEETKDIESVPAKKKKSKVYGKVKTSDVKGDENKK